MESLVGVKEIHAAQQAVSISVTRCLSLWPIILQFKINWGKELLRTKFLKVNKKNYSEKNRPERDKMKLGQWLGSPSVIVILSEDIY